MTQRNLATSLTVLGLAAGLTAGGAALAVEDATVIELTQVGCQFIESENGVDHMYMPKSEKDCVKINTDTGDARLAKANVIELKPGKYVFRVTNKNVPYELGFWLREHDYNWKNPVHKVSKISVSGGGLVLGKTQDYEVTLKPGEYVYSCPLNPTPNYKLVVKG
ncbi:MAG: hypothetical protein QNJ94_12790 [Alphaproteobacteria bacterium]|nr:hypothetical protein [Alphaproteobacteria bacterium]